MEFAKYYNVTSTVKDLVINNTLYCYPKDLYAAVFVCNDTHDFWVCRVQKDIDSNFEESPGTWLVERNKIDKYELLEFYYDEDDSFHASTMNRFKRDNLIDNMDTKVLIETVLKLDDSKGLESWDNEEFSSFDECVSAIDGGYGIIEAV